MTLLTWEFMKVDDDHRGFHELRFIDVKKKDWQSVLNWLGSSLSEAPGLETRLDGKNRYTEEPELLADGDRWGTWQSLLIRWTSGPASSEETLKVGIYKRINGAGKGMGLLLAGQLHVFAENNLHPIVR